MMLDLINFKSCMTHLTHRALRTHLRAKSVRRSAKTRHFRRHLCSMKRHLCSMKVIQVYFWRNHFFKRCFILVCDADADLKLNLKLPAIQSVKGNSVWNHFWSLHLMFQLSIDLSRWCNILLAFFRRRIAHLIVGRVLRMRGWRIHGQTRRLREEFKTNFSACAYLPIPKSCGISEC